MKTIKYFVITLILSGLIFAQSDYEKVQEFKNRLLEIEKEIERADSAEALNAISMELDQLQSDFEGDKELLDQSLYPKNFESSIANLEQKIRSKRKDFVKLEVLEVKVVQLEGELEKLNKRNTGLLAEIKKYQEIGGSPDEVNILISELMMSLNRRDQLVKSMIDSLLTDFANKPSTLSEAELQQVYEKIESDQLFYNVEKTIRDNIEFLRVTNLNPSDVSELKEDQIQFYSMWRKLGPTIAETYSGARDKSEQVSHINGLFSQWSQQLDNEIWNDVNAAFANNNVQVERFNSSEEFIENVSSYIDTQMVGLEKVGYDQSFKNFKNFNEVIWQDELRSTWLPILIDNEMLSVQQKETLESKIEEWEALYEVEPTNWWYYVIPVAVVLLIVIGVLVYKSKSKKERTELATEKS